MFPYRKWVENIFQNVNSVFGVWIQIVFFLWMWSLLGVDVKCIDYWHLDPSCSTVLVLYSSNLFCVFLNNIKIKMNELIEQINYVVLFFVHALCIILEWLPNHFWNGYKMHFEGDVKYILEWMLNVFWSGWFLVEATNILLCDNCHAQFFYKSSFQVMLSE